MRPKCSPDQQIDDSHATPRRKSEMLGIEDKCKLSYYLLDLPPTILIYHDSGSSNANGMPRKMLRKMLQEHCTVSKHLDGSTCQQCQATLVEHRLYVNFSSCMRASLFLLHLCFHRFRTVDQKNTRYYTPVLIDNAYASICCRLASTALPFSPT